MTTASATTEGTAMALHIITGPPASGKTTFVQDNAQPGDIRIDLDHLTNHLAGLPQDGHSHDSRAWAIAKATRNAAIDAALKHSTDLDVWIIDSKPTQTNLERYQKHNAQIHTIDPGKSVVMNRCKTERTPEALKVAALWYATPTHGLTVKSFGYGKTRPRGMVLDARELPNPHQVPALRVPDGTSRRVGEWLSQQAGVNDFIRHAIARIDRESPTEVWVGCAAGKHRSVYVAQRIAEHYGTTAQHTALAPKRGATTTELGLGWDHQKQRRRLLGKHRDGTPCWWCNQPMYRDPAKNWDGKPLEADHSKSRRDHGTKHLADRLLCSTCNRQRGAGDRDNERPSLTGKPFGQAGMDTKPAKAKAAFTW